MAFVFLSDFLRFSLAFCAGVFALAAAPFVVAHVVDHWDAPEYPYSGFCPDAPGCDAEVVDSLPPTLGPTLVTAKGGAL